MGIRNFRRFQIGGRELPVFPFLQRPRSLGVVQIDGAIAVEFGDDRRVGRTCASR